MSEQPARSRPHLWVPYTDDCSADICTLCGEFLTPETGGQECPQLFLDDDQSDPPPEPGELTEPPQGRDDEQRSGVTLPP
jgi:hypothetical protein